MLTLISVSLIIMGILLAFILVIEILKLSLSMKRLRNA